MMERIQAAAASPAAAALKTQSLHDTKSTEKMCGKYSEKYLYATHELINLNKVFLSLKNEK